MNGKNWRVTHCGTGISMPAGARLKVDGLTIEQCDTGIEFRDRPSLVARLGLPMNTPPELLVDALRRLQSAGGRGQQEQAAAVRGSGLFRWLSAGADVTTITEAFVKLQQSGFVARALELLSK